MRELSFEPSEVVLVGDTVHDHEVAEEMGIDCILIEGGHHPSHRLAATGAPVVTSLADVAAFVL